MSAQAVLFDAPGPKAKRRHAIFTIVGSAVIAVLLVSVVYRLSTQGQLEAAKWTPFLTASPWLNYLIPGLIGTLSAAVVSVIAAGMLGLVLGVGRLSDLAWVRWLSGIVVEFFRAVPVLIMMIFLFIIFSRNGVFLPSVNPFMAVVIALTLYNGSVIAELVRSGVNSLPKGQAEAGLSIGLTPGQTLREIELPQALVAMLPALMGQLVVVIKDTALGYGITYSELLNQAKNLGSGYSNTLPAYMVAAALFIVINYAMTNLAGSVERRLKRRGHTAAPVTTTVPNIVQGHAEPGDVADDAAEGQTTT
ncbi:amino acid ABC transporter permease [Micropruina sp.]|uniref:amino acid ABC transporter permease n=1 Tax=Micropruina sp. TaxID=2737536 RepID=UPI0039E6EC4E